MIKNTEHIEELSWHSEGGEFIRSNLKSFVKDHLNSREIGIHPIQRYPNVSICKCTDVIATQKLSIKQVFQYIASQNVPSQNWQKNLRDSFRACSSCTQQGSLVRQKKSILEFAMRRLPGRLVEREHDLQKLDKVFASTWLSETQVILGTKCQKLFVLDINTGSKVYIPNIIRTHGDSEVTNTAQSTGIHSISLNPSKTLLAVGAGNPNEMIEIYRVPTLEPYALLKGHKDMVFSVCWLDDETLVSGSRDKSLKFWSLKSQYVHSYLDDGVVMLPIYHCTSSEIKHKEKVRDVVVDRFHDQTFTLSADGYVKIWDSQRGNTTVSVSLPYVNETVCLGIDPGNRLISVGSQSHISLIDSRSGSVIHNFESLDDGWGVRSMVINENLITIGGGYGRISFYDLRAADYVSWQNAQGNEHKYTLQSGNGWLYRDQIYQRHFQGMEIKNAVYTLSYDSSSSKIFAAGGPLQLNLKGAYSAIWE
jgi:WD repeat-containing protein 40A